MITILVRELNLDFNMKGSIKIAAYLFGGYILYSLLKKKQSTPLTGSTWIPQSNAPTGSTQVFSKANTVVYDQNMNPIFEYDTPNLGMTNTGTFKDNMYSVVIGDSFMNGISGFVYKTDVNTL